MKSKFSLDVMAATAERDKPLEQQSVITKREGLTKYCENCPEGPYLELQIPESMKKLIAIVFRTFSHDQGMFICPNSYFYQSFGEFEEQSDI